VAPRLRPLRRWRYWTELSDNICNYIYTNNDEDDDDDNNDAADFSLGQDRRAEARERGGVWGSWGGATTRSHQLGNLGSIVSSPSGVRGGAPTAAGFGTEPDRPKVLHYFQHSGWPLLTL